MTEAPRTQPRNVQLWLVLSLVSLALGAVAWIVVALLTRQVMG
jgi:hypothetical protein